MSSAPPTTFSRHTLRQLKFIIPGGLTTYYLNTIEILLHITSGQIPGWSRTTALTSFALGAATVAMFLYILLIPWITGIAPNYRSWREAGVLSSVIPALTATIVVGWSLFSVTLGLWSDLGFLEGLLGASGLYALAFGLMGLIPAPKVHRS